MNCITVNNSGEVSQIFQCDSSILTKDNLWQTFASEDLERIERIRRLYKPSKRPILSQDIIDLMKSMRDYGEWGQLRDAIKRYLGIEACCSGTMNEILAKL